MPVQRPRRRGRLRFCPRCKKLMIPKIVNGRKVLVCPNCGYTIELEDDDAYKFGAPKKKSPKDKIIVVDANQPPPTATVLKGQVRCPRCGHDEILFWMMQTRAADEPPTRFYRCLKCGYSWREYD
ncbi:MAG: transcription factor S [Desulfurococcales archaeon]|nr:transcription factor S [Desulfurococcales archaeon]